MIASKSTKFQHFSGNGRTVFKISSKIYLDIIHYKKIKWISVEISMIHLLHYIDADIYIFNKIFNEHKLSQLRGLLLLSKRTQTHVLLINNLIHKLKLGNYLN
jgi:hypothetical protein